MSIADELRRDADAALKEDGMYYSGEYLDGIAKRVEEVEAENAKLREQGARLFDKTLELATENAKLRELVRDFALLTDDVVSHWGIELEAGNSTEAPPAEWKERLYELDMLVSRMREEGIEVEE